MKAKTAQNLKNRIRNSLVTSQEEFMKANFMFKLLRGNVPLCETLA